MTLLTEDYRETPVGRMAYELLGQLCHTIGTWEELPFNAIGSPLVQNATDICYELDQGYRQDNLQRLCAAYERSHQSSRELGTLLEQARRLELLEWDQATRLDAEVTQLQALFRFLWVELEHQLAGGCTHRD